MLGNSLGKVAIDCGFVERARRVEKERKKKRKRRTGGREGGKEVFKYVQFSAQMGLSHSGNFSLESVSNLISAFKGTS